MEIFTSKVEGAGPSRDWQHIVATPRAAAKIRQWFSRERREDAVENGREELVKALRREGLPVQKLAQGTFLADTAKELNYVDLDALHAAIGENHVSGKAIAARIAKKLREVDPSVEEDEVLPTTVRQPRRPGRRQAPAGRRPRRGPRRPHGAPVALLHAGARRRDPRLRHPRPRRVGAPGRLRQRRVAGRRARRTGSSTSSGTSPTTAPSWPPSR